jgi:hypothetical protein
MWPVLKPPPSILAMPARPATYGGPAQNVDFVARNKIDVQSKRDASAHHALLEHGQKCARVLREGKGGVGNDARRVIEEPDEVRLLLAPSGHDDGGAVHHIAHPQLARVLVGEATPVLARGILGPLAHHPSAR